MNTCVGLVCDLFHKYAKDSQAKKAAAWRQWRNRKMRRYAAFCCNAAEKAAADELMKLWTYVRRRMWALQNCGSSCFRSSGGEAQRGNDIDGVSSALKTASTTTHSTAMTGTSW